MPSVSIYLQVDWFLIQNTLVFVLDYFVYLAFPVQADELSDLIESFPGRINLPEHQKGSCRAVIKVNFVFALPVAWETDQ